MLSKSSTHIRPSIEHQAQAVADRHLTHSWPPQPLPPTSLPAPPQTTALFSVSIMIRDFCRSRGLVHTIGTPKCLVHRRLNAGRCGASASVGVETRSEYKFPLTVFLVRYFVPPPLPTYPLPHPCEPSVHCRSIPVPETHPRPNLRLCLETFSQPTLPT